MAVTPTNKTKHTVAGIPAISRGWSFTSYVQALEGPTNMTVPGLKIGAGRRVRASTGTTSLSKGVLDLGVVSIN